MARGIVKTILFVLCCGPFVPALAADSSSDPLRFETHVRAILKQHCFHCHGEEPNPESGLDLRMVRWMLEGGDSGPAIVPGNPEESPLYQRLHDGEMPPDESKLLAESDVQVIRDWIAAGAKTVRPEPEEIDETWITEEELSHWSYQPIVRPAVPAVAASDRVANPIDAFLLRRLEEVGASYSPPAAPSTLVRRLYFDLHGLPPSPCDATAFRDRPDDDTWLTLVNELLGSHHYGERWARHWLDIAGYADSEGYNDSDVIRPDAWRYRDYVIRAFNDDKPYDQFLTEQLAGDELVTSPLNSLSAHDAELLAATGFLRMAPDGTAAASPDPALARNDNVADTIKIVSSALMAMTVGCAQCHDHRYDPISQEDYYRFRAIFEPALDPAHWKTPSQRRISLYTDADRAEAAEVEAEAKKIDAERAEKQKEFIAATFEKQLETIPESLRETARLAHATDVKKRTDEQNALFKKYPKLNVTASSLYLYDKKASDQLKAMADQAAKLRGRKPKEGFVRALTETKGQVPVTKLLIRGDHEQPGQPVEPAGLRVVSAKAELTSIPENEPELETTGRRLALARRLTSPGHPLVARVIVNRVWAHHFGRPLVATPSDFGMLGEVPSHPQLLDWLAAELMDNGWSLKHLHRLILTSEAWRQQLRSDAGLEQVDPDNALFGGARLRRLDAEVVRDHMLAISGRLNSSAFGPAVPVMADLVGRFVVGKENLNAGRPGPKIDMQGEDLRRSIYIQVRRSRPLSVLDTFDLPAMTPNCDRRRPSTSSPQSLLMLNSDFTLRHASDLAERLLRDAGESLSDQVGLAWRLVFFRDPVDDELAGAIAFVQERSTYFASQPAYQPSGGKPAARNAGHDALALMCQMLLSSNEFLYVD